MLERMFGSITVKSRPLRLAFLVPPERVALQKVIETNSTLWGGSYNPIIPLYKRPPAAWRMYKGQKVSIAERVCGYLRAFDPDFLVNCTNQPLPAYVEALNRPAILLEEIWPSTSPTRWADPPRYGVGIFEILNSIYKDFFELQHRFKRSVLLPPLPEAHQLFWMSFLGYLPPTIQSTVEQEYAKAIDIEKPPLDAKNVGSLLTPLSLFPRRITQHRIKVRPSGRWSQDALAIFMDASSVADIIDYWNLRALGRPVFPIPKQFVGIPEFVASIRSYVQSNYRVSAHNAQITHGTTIIRGSSSTMDELQMFASALGPDTIIPGKPNARPISLQHWYPRIWDEWAIGKDGATPDNIFDEEKEFSFQDSAGPIPVQVVKPDFVDEGGLTNTPRFANGISLRFYGQESEVLADVFPPDGRDEVLRAAGGGYFSPDEFRIGRTGLVHLVNWSREIRWKPPPAEDLFFAWLADKGIKAELSSSGRLTKELRSQLRGWLHVLTHEMVLKLLEDMNQGVDGGRGLPLATVKNRLNAITFPRNLYESLVERGVFQLGYKTQCTHCQRASWHDLRSFATELVCPLCHEKLDAISAVDG